MKKILLFFTVAWLALTMAPSGALALAIKAEPGQPYSWQDLGEPAQHQDRGLEEWVLRERKEVLPWQKLFEQPEASLYLLNDVFARILGQALSERPWISFHFPGHNSWHWQTENPANAAPVPESSTFVLMGTGLLLILAGFRRFRKKTENLPNNYSIC